MIQLPFTTAIPLTQHEEGVKFISHSKNFDFCHTISTWADRSRYFEICPLLFFCLLLLINSFHNCWTFHCKKDSLMAIAEISPQRKSFSRSSNCFLSYQRGDILLDFYEKSVFIQPITYIPQRCPYN
jgi:hypothetical protein